jgi:hypothetical protein
MSRSTFILIVSVYSLLVVLYMWFIPVAALVGFGVPAPDKYHIAQHQLMSMPILGLSIVGLMIRHAEPSLGLRAYLTGNATNLIGFTALTAYESFARDIPFTTLFVVDSLWRLALGLGLVYYLVRLKPRTVVNAG